MKEELARFQGQLLAAFADGGDTNEILLLAAERAPDPEMAQWVAQWDPELVELAGVLVRTWAYRAD